MPEKDLCITIIQPDMAWEDKAANLRHYEALIGAIGNKKELVLLPEMFSTGFSMRPEALAETMEGPTVQWMKAQAAQHRIILAGSLIIEEEGRYYNRFVWMQPDGQCHCYNKRHLFAYATEDQHYTAGDKRCIVRVKGWCINLMVCYDLRFPVWARQRAAKPQRQHTAALSPQTPGGGLGSGERALLNSAEQNANLTQTYPTQAPSGGLGADPIQAAAGWETTAAADSASEIHGLRLADRAMYKSLKEFSATHRAEPTIAEEVLWNALCNQKAGFKFRRQHVLGPFIADFVCLDRRVVIEIDGLIHQLPENKADDEERTAWLNDNGFDVLRFRNEEVLSAVEKVVAAIKNRLQGRNGLQQAGVISPQTPEGGLGSGERASGETEISTENSGASRTHPTQAPFGGLGTDPNRAQATDPPPGELRSNCGAAVGAEYDVLLYVANWPARRALAWETLLRARAIENQCYVAGVNRVGEDGKGIRYAGGSRVINALGEILWEGTDAETIHTIVLSCEELKQTRAQFPFLADGDDFVLV